MPSTRNKVFKNNFLLGKKKRNKTTTNSAATQVQIRTKVLLCCWEGFPTSNLAPAVRPTWMKGKKKAVTPSGTAGLEQGQGGRGTALGRDPWGKTEPSKRAPMVRGARDDISWWNWPQHSSAWTALASATVKLSLDSAAAPVYLKSCSRRIQYSSGIFTL